MQPNWFSEARAQIRVGRLLTVEHKLHRGSGWQNVELQLGKMLARCTAWGPRNGEGPLEGPGVGDPGKAPREDVKSYPKVLQP